MSAVFVSCSKDDDNNSNNNSNNGSTNSGSIVGTWEMTHYEGYSLEKKTGEKDTWNLTPGTSNWQYEMDCEGIRAEFTSDNKFTRYSLDEGQWVIDATSTYSYNSSTQIMIIGVGTSHQEEYKLTALNATTMVGEMTEETDEWKDYHKYTYKKIK